MATDALKSTAVTNLDAIPVIPNTTGEGVPGFMRRVDGHVATTAGVLVGSTYRLVRIPTNAKIKRVLFTCAALGGATAFDIDVAYSDATTDYTPPALQGLIPQIAAADNKLFGAAVSAVTAVKEQAQTFANTFTTDMKNTPLWQVLINLGGVGFTDFTVDPGGMFDILLKSTQTNTNGGDVDIAVDFVM
jgi:hypothetical protein